MKQIDKKPVTTHQGSCLCGASTDLSRDAKVTWYRTEKSRRGFCFTCGSSLFWELFEKDWISVAMGTFDKPTGTKLHMHIYVNEKGDYYDINDGLPQNQQQ
jgi:hypothetical protein